jgi:hypothetical protein
MEQIKIENIIDRAKKYGHEVTIRDVAYCLLRTVLDNDLMCYIVVFGTPKKDKDIECYERMDKVKYLFKYFDKHLSPKEKDKSTEEILSVINKNKEKEAQSGESLTFEENKAAMIELIARVEGGIADNTIEPEKGLKIIADLRVKLNDKFKVEDKSTEQYVVVQTKFNHICDYTHKECWLQTKDFAKEHWHLIDDPNYKKR